MSRISLSNAESARYRQPGQDTTSGVERGDIIWAAPTAQPPGLSITAPDGSSRIIATPGLIPHYVVLAQQDLVYITGTRATADNEVESVVAGLHRDGEPVWTVPVKSTGNLLLGPQATLYHNYVSSVTAIVCDQPLANSAWPLRRGTPQNNGRSHAPGPQ